MKQITNIRKESNRFSHFISLMEESNQGLKDPLKTKDIGQEIGGELVTIDIVDVSFRYPNSEEDVLDHLNLTIRPGEKMALVGENGSGKTTLIKLLCKLYKPSSGRIYLNGIDINEIPEDIYWEIIGAVFQDAMVFPFSIKDNITLEENINRERLNKAINDSGSEEIIDGLPQGMESVLLRILDDEGLDISGGQRQRLYLARALYKSSNFLMLDEPTAALDPLAEASLYEQYDLLSQGKTSLYISHRLASTKFCDRVAFLKDGRIVEIGTHDELMDLEGEYKALFNIQAKYYKESDEGKVVWNKLEETGIKSWVESQPKGIKSYFTKIHDDMGVLPSGGQEQKLAIARALARDGNLVILDEPTAALDPKSEEEVFENLINLTKGKTSIFISHRLSSTRIADRIIVLDKGKIIEEGSHRGLIDQDGLYAEMYNTQAKQYVS